MYRQRVTVDQDFTVRMLVRPAHPVQAYIFAHRTDELSPLRGKIRRKLAV